MQRAWNWIGRIADGVSIWQAIVSLGGITVLLSWAASAVEPIAKYGWGAVVFAGLGTAVLTMLSVTASLALFRIFRPVPPLSPVDRQILTPESAPSLDERPVPQEPAVEDLMIPMLAAEFLIDGKFTSDINAAKATLDGLKKQQEAALKELTDTSKWHRAVAPGPFPSPPPPEVKEAQRVVNELVAHVAAAETAVRNAGWKRLWALQSKLERGELIAEGFRKPGDTDPVRIKPAEWRKYSPDENELWFKRVKLGDINYTAVMIGKRKP